MQIDRQVETGRAFFLGDKDDINGGLNSEDLQNIAACVAQDYEGEQINVKNVFDVMKKVFRALDDASPALGETRRKDIANGIVHHVVTLNRDNDTQAFTDRALSLLIDYSIDAIAIETLEDRPSPLEIAETLDYEGPQALDGQISEELQLEDQATRSRIEEIVENEVAEPQLENVQDEIAVTEPILSETQEESELSLVEGQEAPREIIEEMVIPTPQATEALSKAVTQNVEVIENQTQEAIRYIRNTAIEVDEKIADAQQEINSCIEHALESVDAARDQIKEALEGAKNLSVDTKTHVSAIVQDFADKIIDSVSEYTTKKEGEALQREEVETFSQPTAEVAIEEIIAS